jgi:MoaA/NifB/PqqE/SkfB family radical SAM enzyme
LNFKKWAAIINSAKEIGIDQVSFLPADLSSQAFNREILWTEERQHDIAIRKVQLPELKSIIDNIIENYTTDFENGFIAESPEKLRKIYTYYCAFHDLCDFPYKKCNAPWVSTVIEPDGSVKPCFFHPPIGNIRDQSLPEVLNGRKALQFRKGLNIDLDETCKRCVCYLNLSPSSNPF